MPDPTRDIKDLRCPSCKRINRWRKGGVEILSPEEEREIPRVRLICWCGYGLWVDYWEVNETWLGPGRRGM